MTLQPEIASDKKIEYASLVIKTSDDPAVPLMTWGTLRWDGTALQQGWNPWVVRMAFRQRRRPVQVAVQMLMSTVETKLVPGSVLANIIRGTLEAPLEWRIQTVEDGSFLDEFLLKRLGKPRTFNDVGPPPSTLQPMRRVPGSRQGRRLSQWRNSR